jgi:hypothetical protein
MKLSNKEAVLLDCAKDLVLCIRNFELGDYSPLMDELFDIESAIRKYEPKFDERAKAKKNKMLLDK